MVYVSEKVFRFAQIMTKRFPSSKNFFIQKIFGDEGNTVIFEDFLAGTEASVLCLVSKDTIIPLESAKDYKKDLRKRYGRKHRWRRLLFAGFNKRDNKKRSRQHSCKNKKRLCRRKT